MDERPPQCGDCNFYLHECIKGTVAPDPACDDFHPAKWFIKKHPRYTVQRRRTGDGSLYGNVHGSEGCNWTLCKLEISENWYILTNNYDGKITCPKCLKVMGEPL